MLDYLERNLTKSERRTVARYMSQYNNMDAIIQSRKSELFPSKTSTLKEDVVQESNNNNSDSDVYLKNKLYVDDMLINKTRLDLVYNNAKPLHKLIWDEHFINGRADFEIYYDWDNDMTKRSYYREKNELMQVVAECLKIGTKSHQ